MTGYFVRVLRIATGEMETLEIEQLTDDELVVFFANLDRHVQSESRGWAIALAKWIRDNVKATEHQ